jgi:ComF family protein
MRALPKIVADDAMYSVFMYKEKARDLILKFKYSGKMFLAKDFGAQMADKFKQLPFYDKIDCIVPVPLNIVRRIKRGYNQAELLSREISKLTQKPVIRRSLYRKKMTKPQFKLSKEERIKNIKGSFFVKNKERIRNKTILLIDDIITTGATVSACAAALKKSGAKKVYVLSLARD